MTNLIIIVRINYSRQFKSGILQRMFKMAERKVESLLNAIENYDEKLSPEQNTKKTIVNKINALDLIGSSNTAIISLGSQEYILRLTRHNKLILTK